MTLDALLPLLVGSEGAPDCPPGARLFFSRFSLIITPFLLRARIFVAPGSEVGGTSGDSRLLLSSYPVLQALVKVLEAGHHPRHAEFCWDLLLRLVASVADTPPGEGIPAPTSGSEPRVRLPVFTNALISTLPVLGAAWVTLPTGAPAPASSVLRYVHLLSALGTLSPWLLVEGPSNVGQRLPVNAFESPLRCLPPLCVGLIENALGRAVPVESGGEAELALQLGVLELLPFLLPGYNARHSLPASTVRGGDLWLGAGGGGGVRSLSRVYSAALRFVVLLQASTFPLLSGELRAHPDYLVRDAFRRRASALLTSLAVTGSLPLLRTLHRSLREGPSHLLRADVMGALSAVADGLPSEGEAPTAVLVDTFSVLFVDPSHLQAAPADLLPPLSQERFVVSSLADGLLLPLLLRCRKQLVLRVFTSREFFAALRQASDVLGGHQHACSLLYYPPP